MNKDAFLNQWRSNSLRSVLVARGTALHAPIKMPFTHCSKPKADGHGSPAYKSISNSAVAGAVSIRKSSQSARRRRAHADRSAGSRRRCFHRSTGRARPRPLLQLQIAPPLAHARNVASMSKISTSTHGRPTYVESKVADIEKQLGGVEESESPGRAQYADDRFCAGGPPASCFNQLSIGRYCCRQRILVC